MGRAHPNEINPTSFYQVEKTIQAYNKQLTLVEADICDYLASIISEELTEADCKIWHAHPVWFINGNPIVGYSKQKAGIRFMFWSGADFDEKLLSTKGGKFKDASIFYTSKVQVIEEDVKRWLTQSRLIQWDYKNIVKRKGKLERLL